MPLESSLLQFLSNSSYRSFASVSTSRSTLPGELSPLHPSDLSSDLWCGGKWFWLYGLLGPSHCNARITGFLPAAELFSFSRKHVCILNSNLASSGLGLFVWYIHICMYVRVCMYIYRIWKKEEITRSWRLQDGWHYNCGKVSSSLDFVK